MPSSFTKLYAHLVFSTKERRPMIDEAIREPLHGYLASILRKMNSPHVVVGGVADHVHLLFQLVKSLSPADTVKQIKIESSKFAKTVGPKYRDFHWQRGYGMFSVGPLQRGDAENYVRTQEDHHRRRDFQDEYRSFLNAYDIPFDERYLWD